MHDKGNIINKQNNTNIQNILQHFLFMKKNMFRMNRKKEKRISHKSERYRDHKR